MEPPKRFTKEQVNDFMTKLPPLSPQRQQIARNFFTNLRQGEDMNELIHIFERMDEEEDEERFQAKQKRLYQEISELDPKTKEFIDYQILSMNKLPKEWLERKDIHYELFDDPIAVHRPPWSRYYFVAIELTPLGLQILKDQSENIGIVNRTFHKCCERLLGVFINGSMLVDCIKKVGVMDKTIDPYNTREKIQRFIKRHQSPYFKFTLLE